MDRILSYPITPYPLSIAYTDGQPMRTGKSTLLKMLERYQDKIRQILSNDIDDVLIDGEVLLHSVLATLGRVTEDLNRKKSTSYSIHTRKEP